MKQSGVASRPCGDTSWTFLTNHGHVLLTLYCNPTLRQRDIAHAVGITEGAVKRILLDLRDKGHVEIHRCGRRNRYEVHPDKDVQDLLERLAGSPARRPMAENAS